MIDCYGKSFKNGLLEFLFRLSILFYVLILIRVGKVVISLSFCPNG